ncbi:MULTISPECIES: pilin [unclassified Francisella]|uniref:pilin n=1 Tax=unclassified Francisella TaxID=2610885 RepID=UPI002E2FC747|nr:MULTISPECIES: prepilin-type N-terminal cleavage/methylation domain-containing protein [unclassified Francisella]MED7819676.1 prepilin-type N-terminal cleavage/methylation domain-containing protein [Francisella sp. 19S2-4]MED7830502.1 prepilin-type N-terminal cleavage/methylation domain-containing protein [Francisella sp. 19S2-10]
MKKKRSIGGFSLVELMVVIAIIAVLAAIAIPMYSNYTTRAKFSSEISKFGGVKAEIAEAIGNGSALPSSSGTFTIEATGTLATTEPDANSSVSLGEIRISTSDIISGSSVHLQPYSLDSSSSLEWKCLIGGANVDITQSQVPSDCIAYSDGA